MSEYVPTTAQVRDQFAAYVDPRFKGDELDGDTFDRWLASVKAEALREAFNDYIGEWPYMRKAWGGKDDPESEAARSVAIETMKWLRWRAVQIQEGHAA